jgi:hypothetical protein
VWRLLSDQRERFPNPAMPFSLTLPVPPPGAEGDKHETPRTRGFLFKQTGHFCPPHNSGGRNEPEQITAGAKRPTLRRRISDWHASRMLA